MKIFFIRSKITDRLSSKCWPGREAAQLHKKKTAGRGHPVGRFPSKLQIGHLPAPTAVEPGTAVKARSGADCGAAAEVAA